LAAAWRRDVNTVSTSPVPAFAASSAAVNPRPCSAASTLKSGAQREHRGGGLLARFDPGLMIGVDSDQRRIKSGRTFEESDQRADRTRPRVRKRQRERVSPPLRERAARALEEGRQIVAARDAGFDVDRGSFPILQHFDEKDEEVVDAVAQLLHVGVLVRRSAIRNG
jgi:hypothetical protein